MKWPELFLERMKDLLNTEYDAWLKACEEPPVQGIRINPAKLTPQEWEAISPWEICPVIWNPYGYYCEPNSRPAKDIYYYAGLYYVQEPSAMAPAAVLQVQPGDRVLDLCAAPGGKSTELGARLKGEGLLVSNDISASRARALLKNLELAGITNCCVTAEEPGKLAETFGAYFDKILVDAPCSGEGMFRKEPELVKSWLERGPMAYVSLQREILKQAARMLKPGGEMVYSTCTFSPEEDEGAVDWLLEQMPELELAAIAPWEGAASGINGKPVIRLFPHRVRGEGHFIALLRRRKDAIKDGAARKAEDAMPEGCRKKNPAAVFKTTDSNFAEWEKFLAQPFDRERMMVRDGQVYYLPADFDPGWRLRYLRTGLLLGSVSRGRFEPSQAMAMALKPGEYARTLSLKREDERIIRYLKGESIFLTEGESPLDGWVLVCVEHYPLGWAKAAGRGLKNKYYPGWRWQ